MLDQRIRVGGLRVIAVGTDGPDIIRCDGRDTIEIVVFRPRTRAVDKAPLRAVPVFGERAQACSYSPHILLRDRRHSHESTASSKVGGMEHADLQAGMPLRNLP